MGAGTADQGALLRELPMKETDYVFSGVSDSRLNVKAGNEACGDLDQKCYPWSDFTTGSILFP